MSRHITHRLKPEEEELERKRAELAAIKAIVVDRELELTDRRNELAALEGSYLRQVGVLYAELDEWTAKILDLKARLRPSASAQHRADTAHEQARQTYESSHGEEAKAKDFNPSPDLKKLFREAARRVHPDFAADPADLERRTRLMADLNRAYREEDEDALQRILDEYDEPGDTDTGTGAALVRIIRQISHAKERIAAIGRELETLLKSEIAQLKREVDEAQQKGCDMLAELAASVRAKIQVAEKEYSLLSQELGSR